MAQFSLIAAFVSVLIFCQIGLNSAQSRPPLNLLTPPYFNLAYERKVEATSTCGVGSVTAEQFCKLTGADPTSGDSFEGDIIEGQLCDICVSEERAMFLGERFPAKRQFYLDRVHPPSSAVDGSERWWQSPHLSRGLRYNEVNLTVDLGQVS